MVIETNSIKQNPVFFTTSERRATKNSANKLWLVDILKCDSRESVSFAKKS